MHRFDDIFHVKRSFDYKYDSSGIEKRRYKRYDLITNIKVRLLGSSQSFENCLVTNMSLCGTRVFISKDLQVGEILECLIPLSGSNLKCNARIVREMYLDDPNYLKEIGIDFFDITTEGRSFIKKFINQNDKYE
jgi:hypothetical protein